MTLNIGNQPRRIQKLALHPLVIISSLILGGLTGYFFPEMGRNIGFMGVLYVDLLKMIVLPFMVSAVIFSVRSIFINSENLGGVVKRLFKWYVISLVVVAIAGVGSALLFAPGSNLNEGTLKAFGNIIQSDKNTNLDLNITLSEPEHLVEERSVSTMNKILDQMIPINIFAALSHGDTIKVLVFSMLFGLSMGFTPAKLSDALMASLETVFIGCQRLTKWFNLMLPLASFAMAADQLATTGLEPMRLMISFLEVLLLVSCVLLCLGIFAIWHKSGRSLGEVLSSQQESFFMAISTRSSTSCMPSMLESLVWGLKFNKAEVDLLVPIGISLLRTGPIVFYTVATIFIAQLYGHELSLLDVMLVFSVSILVGIASTGMNSIVSVAQTGLVCSYLGLPFEAAFVLFVAVDPLSDMLRTAISVVGINAVTALICTKPDVVREPDISQANENNPATGLMNPGSKLSPRWR